MPEARDGYFTTDYAFNKIILDIIRVKFDIQVDDRTITQSRRLHDDIPGYNLLTLEFVLPPVNDDEDLILKEENPEIYAHLENVLVHMIDAQDVAIFKSQKDYVRNKQRLLEYICGIAWYTRCSGWTLLHKSCQLWHFWGIFKEMHFGCAASEVHHLVCQCNVIQ